MGGEQYKAFGALGERHKSYEGTATTIVLSTDYGVVDGSGRDGC
jgi:hypothetical protein